MAQDSSAFALVLGGDPTLYAIVLLSLVVSLSATALAAVAGLPLGALIALVRFPGRPFVIVVMNAFMGLPPVVVGLAVYLMLSRSGPLGFLGILFTPRAMILAQALLVIPIIAALTRQTIEDLWAEYRDELTAMRVGPFARILTLVWDARFSLVTALLAGFGRAAAEVGAVMIVGGNIEHRTRVLTTAIVLETNKGDFDLAIALGLLLLGLQLFDFKIPCLVCSRSLRPDDQMIEAANTAQIPIFRTPQLTMNFISQATLNLESMFAPRGSEMGSMVDILGVGVVIKGESGVGKSESVLALIERGYSLVADDIVKVHLEDGKHVIGTSSPLTRDRMEVRGIGIINVAAMFGIKSIRSNKRVDLVISLKPWQDVPDVDRLGMEQQFIEILGTKIPHMIIPIRPGRDIARLIEVAAMHTKLTITGYNPAQELNERLIAQMADAARKQK